MEPITVVQRFLDAWIANDLTEAMSFVAQDCSYSLYLSGDVVPFGGETVGRENIAATLRQVRSDFEYLLFRPYNFHAEGDGVRYRVEFMYRHLASGEILTGRLRLVMRVRDGLLVTVEEYHDRPMVGISAPARRTPERRAITCQHFAPHHDQHSNKQ